MTPEDSSPTSRMGFQSLPAELRLQVYDDYLSSCSHPDTKVIYHDIPPCHDKHSTLPLLLVSKQVSDEVLYRLCHRKQVVYRITWWNHGFDDLALSCLKARKMKSDDYANIPHLRIEIYPPHPDRTTGMMDIFSYTQALCKRLSVIDRLHHVSIVFVEDSIARWTDTAARWVLDSLAILTNMTKANIELSPSLTNEVFPCGQSFQEFKASLERSMMDLESLDPESVLWAQDIHSVGLEYEESTWQYDVGRKLLLIFTAIDPPDDHHRASSGTCQVRKFKATHMQ